MFATRPDLPPSVACGEKHRPINSGVPARRRCRVGFAAQADTVIGSLHSTYSRTAKIYDERAKDLRKRVSGMHAPFIGGQSESSKASLELDEDRVKPAFARKQFISPWRGSPQGPGPVIPGEGPL